MADSFFEQYRILLDQAIAEKCKILCVKKFDALHEVTEAQGELRGLQKAMALMSSVVDNDD